MSEPVQQHVHIYSLSTGLPQPLTASDLQSSHFDISFERAIADLELLPRMFIELDGSLVWCGEVEARRWQIDGMIYDRAGHVLRVELKGAAPRQAWEQLLSIFGWPNQPLIAHDVDQQRFVELADFLSSTS
ncbi:MAG: hypothetical protein IT422_12450 [Pirellulaceae bacterium]|jgi:hypothetical protein|nr:hypothetical protein [Pirellulaceae bacterium]